MTKQKKPAPASGFSDERKEFARRLERLIDILGYIRAQAADVQTFKDYAFVCRRLSDAGRAFEEVYSQLILKDH